MESNDTGYHTVGPAAGVMGPLEDFADFGTEDEEEYSSEDSKSPRRSPQAEGVDWDDLQSHFSTNLDQEDLSETSLSGLETDKDETTLEQDQVESGSNQMRDIWSVEDFRTLYKVFLPQTDDNSPDIDPDQDPEHFKSIKSTITIRDVSTIAWTSLKLEHRTSDAADRSYRMYTRVLAEKFCIALLPAESRLVAKTLHRLTTLDVKKHGRCPNNCVAYDSDDDTTLKCPRKKCGLDRYKVRMHQPSGSWVFGGPTNTCEILGRSRSQTERRRVPDVTYINPNQSLDVRLLQSEVYARVQNQSFTTNIKQQLIHRYMEWICVRKTQTQGLLQQ